MLPRDNVPHQLFGRLPKLRHDVPQHTVLRDVPQRTRQLQVLVWLLEEELVLGILWNIRAENEKGIRRLEH